MRIASYTDLRNNVDHYVDAVINDCDTIEGRNGGANDLVLMSLEEYNSIMETLYIMSSPQLVEDIRQGEEDIKNGLGIEVDLEALKKEIEALEEAQTVDIAAL